jgi:hypothetical protein
MHDSSIPRLEEELSQQEVPYNIIIILGGTNDIAYETPVSEIIGNLRSMLGKPSTISL